MNVYIETSRLIVRTACDGDLQELRSLQCFGKQLVGMQGHHMVIVSKDESDKIVGYISYNTGSRFSEGYGQLGYWCGDEYRRKGYTLEAAHMVTRYAFDVIGLTRIAIFMVPENIASAAIPKRLGFHYTGAIYRRTGGMYLRYVCMDVSVLPELLEVNYGTLFEANEQ